MLLAAYLTRLENGEAQVAAALHDATGRHGDEPDVAHQCRRMVEQTRGRQAELAPFSERYGDPRLDGATRSPAPAEASWDLPELALLADLHRLFLQTADCLMLWTLVSQAAQGARDDELLRLAQTGIEQLDAQSRWLQTRMKQAAPQALIVA